MKRPKRRTNGDNTTRNLILLICVLVVVLTVLVIVALVTRNDGKPGQETQPGTTAGTQGSTGNPTDGTTEPAETTETPTEPLVPNPPVTPPVDHSEYLDVGTGLIVEILNSSAETFDGRTTDDKSFPDRNYLPAGTVDYCSEDTVSNSSQTFRVMRCGRKVYIRKRNYPPESQKIDVVKCYPGSLPDHNELALSSLEVVGHHTVLTLDTLWKAPFYFHMAPQEYIDEENRDYRVSKLTVEYVDITFCYATSFDGIVQIPADNPLFSRAEFTQNEKDCTLRLYLKKVGGFYGWDAFYNEQDQLCFRFVNPVKATSTNANSYGADLNGVRVMLDVGHGGYDGGAAVKNSAGVQVDEAELNLKLALAAKKELESMGAIVIMNRTDDSELTVDQRINFLKDQAADICIAIHHDSEANYPNVSGAMIGYYTSFSQKLADLLYKHYTNSGIFKKVQLKTNMYYVGRETPCPVVLTENGFMTNAEDLAAMENPTMIQGKAKAIARAVAEYFMTME